MESAVKRNGVMPLYTVDIWTFSVCWKLGMHLRSQIMYKQISGTAAIWGDYFQFCSCSHATSQRLQQYWRRLLAAAWVCLVKEEGKWRGAPICYGLWFENGWTRWVAFRRKVERRSDLLRPVIQKWLNSMGSLQSYPLWHGVGTFLPKGSLNVVTLNALD